MSMQEVYADVRGQHEGVVCVLHWVNPRIELM